MVKLFVRVIFSVAFAIIAGLSPLSAQEIVGGTLEVNTVFSPTLNPYIVTEPLIVPEGITLTVEPGVELYFLVSTSLVIDRGTLLAEGLPAQPILFTAESGDKWDGLNFSFSRTQFDIQGNYVSGNILRHVSVKQTTTAIVLSDSARILADSIVIENGDYGVTLISGAEIKLTGSIIDQCSFGMSIKNSGHNIISSCRISNCDIGIFFPSNNQSSYNRISNNTLSNNRIIGLFMSIGQSKMQFNQISGNTIISNNIGLYIGNGGVSDMGYNSVFSNIVRLNDIGIKLSQDTDTIRANLIENNATGLFLVKAGRNHILNNIIQNNSLLGLLLSDSSYLNTVSGNGIYNNYTGIKVTHKDFRHSVNNLFNYNSLTGNLNEALLFESGPQQPLEFNSISGTRDTAIFVNRFYTDLEAPNNWFGSIDTAFIDSLIYDYYDQYVYGKVIYKPFLTGPDPGTPIAKPFMVIKRLAGNQVAVDWHKNSETDLAGYKVYYGQLYGNDFTHVIDAGTDTLILISDITLDDTIAVTAYDTEANGFEDQFEGHESAYSYAIAGPWAGSDTLICEGGSYLTASATAPDGQNLEWTTSGDGFFSMPSDLVTLYSPGEADILNGSVTLTLQQITEQYLLTDWIVIQIGRLPFVYAGVDTTISMFETFHTTSAEAGNYENLLWTTTGDGSFDDPQVLLTSYQPGVSDISQGSVMLILELTSPCGNPSDTLSLEIIPTFAVHGKVSKDTQPADDGLVIAISIAPDLPRAVSTAYTNSGGEFDFSNLPAGNYLLYAITNPQAGYDWVPTYYTESYVWQSAYQLTLNTDVYGIDISMVPVGDKLPSGNGSISGSFNYQGKISEDDSIYRMPWFNNRSTELGTLMGYPASNHTVLLMNTGLSRVFNWTLTASDGSFSFTRLPYGSYRLWGEKAGYTNSISPVITISPQNNQVEGVQLEVKQKNIEITLPHNSTPDNDVMLYPNPATNWIWFNDNAIGDFNTLKIRFIDTMGRQVKETVITRYTGSPAAGIDVSDISPGLYICYLAGDNGFSGSYKIAVAR